jgi:hypothetical protein
MWVRIRSLKKTGSGSVYYAPAEAECQLGEAPTV